MANWCENTIDIYGDEKDFQEFYDLFKETDDDGKEKFVFNFTKIIPTPKELENTTSPVRIISQEDYDKVQELYKKHGKKDVWASFNENKISKEERDLMFQNGITQEISDRLESEYGSDNWYTWANDNWGTKWDIDDENINDMDDTWCQLNFRTAWSCCQPIVDKLKEMFPNLDISGHYLGEGNEFAGIF